MYHVSAFSPVRELILSASLMLYRWVYWPVSLPNHLSVNQHKVQHLHCSRTKGSVRKIKQKPHSAKWQADRLCRTLNDITLMDSLR